LAPSVQNEFQPRNDEMDNIWERLQAAGLIPATLTVNEYNNVDEQLITASNFDGNVPDPVEEEYEDDADDIEITPPTITECITCLGKIRHYMQCTLGFDDSPMNHLDKLEEEIRSNALKRQKQKKITDYFTH